MHTSTSCRKSLGNFSICIFGVQKSFGAGHWCSANLNSSRLQPELCISSANFFLDETPYRSRKTLAGGQTAGRLSLDGGGSRHGIYKSVCFSYIGFLNAFHTLVFKTLFIVGFKMLFILSEMRHLLNRWPGMYSKIQMGTYQFSYFGF